MAVALGAGRAAPAQSPGYYPPPPGVPTPQLPPAGPLAPAPRPQLVPADAVPAVGTMPFLANPTPPAALPVLAPAPTLTFTKPAGSETTRPPVAQPVSRTLSGVAPVAAYPTRPAAVPVVVPVAAQPPRLPDSRTPDKSPEDKAGGPGTASKEKQRENLAPVFNANTNAPPIKRADAFRFDDDAELNQRIVAELVEFERRKFETDKPGEKFVYDPRSFAPPQSAKVGVTGVAYSPKTASYGATVALIEPGYVVHRRLLFEEKNSERYGWDFGIIQPFVSTAAFYKDALLMPAHVASNLFERYDTSAGKCLPGNPVPYYLYPEEITLFGATVGALGFVGTAYVFP